MKRKELTAAMRDVLAGLDNLAAPRGTRVQRGLTALKKSVRECRGHPSIGTVELTLADGTLFEISARRVFE